MEAIYGGETAHFDVIKMNVSGCPAITVDTQVVHLPSPSDVIWWRRRHQWRHHSSAHRAEHDDVNWHHVHS